LAAEPKVSIVIPVYNGSNYMREAIDSALGQTYQNCEVIVVNDGSDDGGATESIARSYGDQIRYFAKENGGVATAVNYGIERMTGEYFAWLSHDDVFYPEKIQRQIQAIQASGIPNAISHCNFDFLYMDTGKRLAVEWENQYDKEQLEDGCFAPVFLCIHGSTVLIHRSHFDRVGLYDPALRATQDSEFLFRAMRGQKSVFVPDRLMAGRVHREQGQRTMACHGPEYNRMFVDFCEKLTDREKIHMCGSEVNFYYRLYLLLKYSKPADTVLDYLRKKIAGLQAEIPGGEPLFNQELRSRGLDRVYIFGAGQYGREALELLHSYRAPVSGFLDNSPEKQGTVIEGAVCYGPKDVEDLDKTLFIVAMIHDREVLEQLRTLGAKHVTTYGALRKALFKVTPLEITF